MGPHSLVASIVPMSHPDFDLLPKHLLPELPTWPSSHTQVLRLTADEVRVYTELYRPQQFILRPATKPATLMHSLGNLTHVDVAPVASLWLASSRKAPQASSSRMTTASLSPGCVAPGTTRRLSRTPGLAACRAVSPSAALWQHRHATGGQPRTCSSSGCRFGTSPHKVFSPPFKTSGRHFPLLGAGNPAEASGRDQARCHSLLAPVGGHPDHGSLWLGLDGICAWSLQKCLTGYDPQTLTLLRKVVSQVFYSGEHTSHWAETMTCRHCGAPGTAGGVPGRATFANSCCPSRPPMSGPWYAVVSRRHAMSSWMGRVTPRSTLIWPKPAGR